MSDIQTPTEIRPVGIDFFSGEGGASKGYEDAGFRMIGIDKYFQSRYPYKFVQGDAIACFQDMIYEYHPAFIAGSPVCKAHTKAQRIMGNDHYDFIPEFRQLCITSGLPYVIENVVGAPLIDPVMLCGTMFPGLNTYRHRLFESNITLTVPAHPSHSLHSIKMGRWVDEGEWYHAVGNFSNVKYIGKNMGVPWMTRDGMAQSIPPVYAELIGRQILAAL
jgi:DNA (cytosine-5)-methyltransferase 1